MSGLVRDVQIGVRMLLKRPGTSALAVAAIALGTGLTTTMFSIVDAPFLRGLPFDRPAEIVAISRMRVNAGGFSSVPPYDFLDWQAAQHSVQELAGRSTFQGNMSIAGQPPERYRAARITFNTLGVLRVGPVIGRDFTEADSRADALPVALISH